MLRKLKDLYIKMLIKVVRPPNYVWETLILNALGLQLLRVAGYEIRHAWRGLFYAPAPIEPHRQGIIDAYERDGVFAAPSFFTDHDFDRLTEAYETLMADVAAKPTSFGGSIKDFMITGLEDCPHRRFIYDLFTQDRFINAVVERTRKKRAERLPRVTLQEVIMPEGAQDRGNSTTVLHSDRYHHHAKVFFYMNDQTAAEGAYIFAPGSHRYTSIWRLVHEYDLSVRFGLRHLKKRLGLKSTTPLVQHRTDLIRPSLLPRLGFEPRSVEGKANTLVMSDNRGFHARGQLQPGRVRKQVRLQYQYLEAPFYARALLDFTGLFYPFVRRQFN